MYYGCYCKEFMGVEKSWSPEGVQRCALVEWVKGELWNIIVREEFERRMVEGGEGEESKVSERDEEWDDMSNAASEGWSVVSVMSGYEMVDV